MCQITGGEHMRQRRTREMVDAAAFGQMDLDKGAMFAAHAAKWIERLNHAGALCPTTACATG